MQFHCEWRAEFKWNSWFWAHILLRDSLSISNAFGTCDCIEFNWIHFLMLSIFHWDELLLVSKYTIFSVKKMQTIPWIWPLPQHLIHFIHITWKLEIHWSISQHSRTIVILNVPKKNGKNELNNREKWTSKNCNERESRKNAVRLVYRFLKIIWCYRTKELCDWNSTHLLGSVWVRFSLSSHRLCKFIDALMTLGFPIHFYHLAIVALYLFAFDVAKLCDVYRSVVSIQAIFRSIPYPGKNSTQLIIFHHVEVLSFSLSATNWHMRCAELFSVSFVRWAEVVEIGI